MVSEAATTRIGTASRRAFLAMRLFMTLCLLAIPAVA
jgi:hypothetical protein